MKSNVVWKFLFLFFCVFILMTACFEREADESPGLFESGNPVPTTASDTPKSEGGQNATERSSSVQGSNSEEKPQPSGSDETSVQSSHPSRDSSVVLSQPSSAEEAVPVISITVIKRDILGATEKAIEHEAQITKILTLVEGMFVSDYSAQPSTGGELIDVIIVRDGVTEKYLFLSEEVDGYCLAKNLQHPDAKNVWYFADVDSFAFLSGLF